VNIHARSFLNSRLVSTIAIMVSLVSASVQAELKSTFAKVVDSIAKDVIKEDGTPGMSIAVAKGSEIIHAKGYGYADITDKKKAKSDHIYRIGSVTKQFTSAAIMQLVEQGKINLDDPLTKYVPDFPSPGENVTVTHLLQHTSGIRSYTNLASFMRLIKEPTTHQQLIDIVSEVEFDFQPGEEFRYNNSGYYLLGVIIEQVSGQTYADYLKDHVYPKAGLTDTGYGANEYPTPQHARGYMLANKKFKDERYMDMSRPFAAGSLESTVEDLMRWNYALRNGKVVSAESYEMMTTNGTLNNGEKIQYGFGLFVGEMDGRPMVQHGGGIHGFSCMMAYFPDEDVALAVLTNLRQGHGGQITMNIAKELFE